MTVRILVGDVRARLADLPDASVQTVVTSPPYYGLRDYAVPGQLGLEPSLSAYLATMVEVFRAVRRVLRPDGTCWLNIGDSYCSHDPGGRRDGEFLNPGGRQSEASTGARNKAGTYARGQHGLKPKDLMLVPFRLAIALQDDGWYVRSSIVWHKRAPMPESVTDRPTSAHEHIFLLTKNKTYFYDSDAVREDTEPYRMKEPDGWDTGPGSHGMIHRNGRGDGATKEGTYSGRNLRNVWTLSPEPFPAAHFATFVTEIPRRCIKAGTSERGACSACGAPWRRVVEKTELRDRRSNPGQPAHLTPQGYLRDGGSRCGVNESITTGWMPSCSCGAGIVPCRVLDPFLGSGTTLLVADELGRDGIGIELNETYAQMAEQRIRGASPLFAAVDVA